MHQVLDLTVREALAFFSAARRRCCGGCRCSTRSASATCAWASRPRRCRAARRSGSRSRRTWPSHGGERLLYILDEPTTGLHFDDIAKLLAAFRQLLQAGHSLLVIEHNLDVIKTADYIIDLGPEGGDEGGRVVATGTPEEIAAMPGSHTGRYLRQVLTTGRRAEELGAMV